MKKVTKRYGTELAAVGLYRPALVGAMLLAKGSLRGYVRTYTAKCTESFFEETSVDGAVMLKLQFWREFGVAVAVVSVAVVAIAVVVFTITGHNHLARGPKKGLNHCGRLVFGAPLLTHSGGEI